MLLQTTEMQQEVVSIRHASMSAFSSREVPGLLAAGALEYGRAGDGVLLTDGVGVDRDLKDQLTTSSKPDISARKAHLDVGIGVLAIPRNGRLIRSIRRRTARPSNNNLRALGIELRGIRLMKGDQLMADEIIARSKTLRDGAGPRLVSTNQLGDVPARGRFRVEEDRDAVAVEAGLVDLEPVRPGPVAGAEGSGALVHPDDDGALAVRPLAPGGRDAVAGGGRGAQLG